MPGLTYFLTLTFLTLLKTPQHPGGDFLTTVREHEAPFTQSSALLLAQVSAPHLNVKVSHFLLFPPPVSFREVCPTEVPVYLIQSRWAVCMSRVSDDMCGDVESS